MRIWTESTRFDSVFPPVILKRNLSGWWVVSNGIWYQAPEHVTLDMVRAQWAPPKLNQSVPKTIDIEIEVRSTDGKRTYMVRQFGNMETCTCPGFEFHGKCKHLKELKKSIR